MSPKWMKRLGLAAIAGTVASVSVGCAQERDPINRVQAGALSKHFFVGDNLGDPSDDPEFFMRNTVIDVPYGAAQNGLFTASYAQPMNRVKWEVTEGALIARQTHERINNSDHHGSKRTNDGQVVGMFRIASHFDIRRSYNPTTGEELNIIEENQSDRPWYDREYMRVDWSQNMVTDGYEVDTLSMIGLFGGVKFAPMAYRIEDPNDKNAPLFDTDDGYFDVTTKAFATPQSVNTPWGSFPSCFFPAGYFGTGHPVENCNPTEVTLRLSFKRVVDNDFEPSEWDGNKMEAFGWFLEERFGYERNYGVLDEHWHPYAAKHNIWQKSHIEGSQCAVDYWRDENGKIAKYRVDGEGQFLTDPATGLPIPDETGQAYRSTPVGSDPHRDADANKTEDECEFYDKDGNLLHAGAYCDVASNKCSLPLYERTVKTVPWYYGPDAPADLFASTADALNQWNVAILRAAQIGKKVEASRVGLDGSQFEINEARLNCATLPESKQKEMPECLDGAGNAVTDIPPVFVLCHNPTIDSDHPACMKDTPEGPRQVYARIGDIRYNSVNIIDTPQDPSPWGIMVDANDPLTGEKISSSVNEWGHVLDLVAQKTVDLLRWFNGEVSDDDVLKGRDVAEHMAATKLGTVQYRPNVLSKEEIRSRLASQDLSMRQFNGLTPADARLPARLAEMKASQNLAQNLGPSIDPEFEAKRQSLIGTEWEARMITPEMMQLAGFHPDTPFAGDDNLIAQASPLRGQNPAMVDWLDRMKNLNMAQRGFCMVEQPEPTGYVGLARQAAARYPLPHLRNTSDPLYAAQGAADYPEKLQNRNKQIWQWIRETFHMAVIAHEFGHSMGLRHNFTSNLDALNFFPQYWQLRTQNGKERACSDATTPHVDGHDCVGPRWIDPVTDEEVNGLVWKWGATTVMDYPGDTSMDMNGLGAYDKAAVRFTYANVVDVEDDAKVGSAKGDAYMQALDGFGGIGGRTIGGLHYSQYQDQYNVLGECSAQTDPNDPLSATCTGAKLDHVSIRDMTTQPLYSEAVMRVRPDLVANFAVDPKGRVRHPYMFGSDEYADIGNIPVFRFDSGADPYEQMQFFTSTYENRYIFDFFRRGRRTFSSRGTFGRVLSRVFKRIQGMTKSLALMIQRARPQDLEDPGGYLPLRLAVDDGFSLMTRVLTRPEPGAYKFATGNGFAVPYAQRQDLTGDINDPEGDFAIAVGAGEGRYLHNEYDYTKGYWWGRYQLQVGSFYEKVYSVYFLTEAYNRFVENQREDYLDGRYKNLNFSSLFPQQMRRLFSNIMAGDVETLGPFVAIGAPGQIAKGATAHVQYLPWEKYDPNTPGTVNLDYSADAVVINPLVGWNQQYPSLINWFIFGPTTLTMDSVNMMRVFVPGGVDTIDIPLDQQIRFRDPNSGIRYVARTYGTEVVNARIGHRVERAPGAHMIQYANELAAKTYQVQSTDPQTGEHTFVMQNGQPVCATDAVTCKANDTQLRGFVSNLDVVRQLTQYMGYGPLGR